MSSEITKHLKRFAGLSDVLIVVFGLALWAMWPVGMGAREKMRVAGETRVAYEMFSPGDARPFNLPDSFISSSVVGHEKMDDTKTPETLVSGCARTPRFLERTPVTAETGTTKLAAMIPVAGDTNSNSILWDSERLFSESATADPQIVVEMPDEFKKRGFQMPELRFSGQGKLDKPWMVTVYVDIGEDGGARNVFLDSACEDQKINDTIVKTVARGRVESGGAKFEGHITVNYGGM